MRKAKLEPKISYSAGNRACEKGTLQLVAKLEPEAAATTLGAACVRKARSGSRLGLHSANLDDDDASPDITVRHSAGSRACETSAKWQQEVVSATFSERAARTTRPQLQSARLARQASPMSPSTGRELDYWDF